MENVADIDDKPTIGGGVQDVYGEDRATEDQSVTPWNISVARCVMTLVICYHKFIIILFIFADSEFVVEKTILFM